MHTARSSNRREGGGFWSDLIPLNFPLGCGPGSDSPQFLPWLWAWIWSPSISPLSIGLDLIPLNFPWLWAWSLGRVSASLGGMSASEGVCFWGRRRGGGICFFGGMSASGGVCFLGGRTGWGVCFLGGSAWSGGACWRPKEADTPSQEADTPPGQNHTHL